MSAPIPGQTWKHDGLLLHYLTIEETKSGDDVMQVWIGVTDDGPSVMLSPDKADDIADSLKARAALMRETADRAVTS